MITAEYSEDGAQFTVEPEHGKRVVFDVRFREVAIGRQWHRKYEKRFVVGLAGSAGDGFSQHLSYEAAVKRALSRARQYEKAYARPLRAAS